MNLLLLLYLGHCLQFSGMFTLCAFIAHVMQSGASVRDAVSPDLNWVIALPNFKILVSCGVMIIQVYN